jgi:hypothetical protein
MTNDRPHLSSEGAYAIDKTILVNVNRNKYPVVGPTWALKPGLSDRLVVGRNVTLTLTIICQMQIMADMRTKIWSRVPMGLYTKNNHAGECQQ